MPHRPRLGCMLLLSSSLLAPAAARSGPAAPDSLAPSPRVRAWQTGARPDRLQHAGLAFTLALGAGLAARRPGLAAAGVGGLGLLKEIRDTRHGGFDPVDLAAGAAGAALGALAARAATP